MAASPPGRSAVVTPGPRGRGHRLRRGAPLVGKDHADRTCAVAEAASRRARAKTRIEIDGEPLSSSRASPSADRRSARLDGRSGGLAVETATGGDHIIEIGSRPSWNELRDVLPGVFHPLAHVVPRRIALAACASSSWPVLVALPAHLFKLLFEICKLLFEIRLVLCLCGLDLACSLSISAFHSSSFAFVFSTYASRSPSSLPLLFVCRGSVSTCRHKN